MQVKNLFEGENILTLTETAKKILEESGGRNFIDNNLHRLIEKVNRNDLKSPLDVQNVSATAIINEFDSRDFRPVNNYIINDILYNDETVNNTTIAFIMGIYLRDRYFEINPHLRETQAAAKQTTG